MISGVETEGSGSSMNQGQGPKLLGSPETGTQKFYARKKYYTICGFWNGR